MNEEQYIQGLIWNNLPKQIKLRLRTKMPDYDWSWYNKEIKEGG